MLLLTLRGTPTIFYGDELGMVDQAVPPERQRDYFGLTDRGASRDPIRTPMPWEDAPNGGFSTAHATDLWLPVAADYGTINVAAQLRDPDSMLNLYRRLIELRHSKDALRLGTYKIHGASDSECLLYLRSHAGERLLVALNLSSKPKQVKIDERGTIAVATAREREGEQVADDLRLGPDDGLVIELEGGT